MRRALCVGINRYAQSPLRGCVNDANDWATILRSRGYSVETRLDERARKTEFVAALHRLVLGATRGDRIVFTYSGHGTYVPDADGDEADQRDEALVTQDMKVITDDELFGILGNLPSGVRLTIISDSCHSGTMTRLVGGRNALGTPRFLPPESLGLQSVARGDQSSPPRSKAMLLSGCKDDEVSYDAEIGGRFRGAMTAAAISALQNARSMKDWHAQTLQRIGYPQTPQLTATSYQRHLRPLS